MIYLASDHAGFELKKKVESFLKAKGYEVDDIGPHHFDPKDDYPDFIYPAAQKVAGHPGSFAIGFGKSGQGEAMVANKVPGVRAAVYYGGSKELIKLSREHNNANVLSVGAGFISEKEAEEAIDLWLTTKFTNEERHERRIDKIKSLESGNHD